MSTQPLTDKQRHHGGKYWVGEGWEAKVEEYTDWLATSDGEPSAPVQELIAEASTSAALEPADYLRMLRTLAELSWTEPGLKHAFLAILQRYANDTRNHKHPYDYLRRDYIRWAAPHSRWYAGMIRPDTSSELAVLSIDELDAREVPGWWIDGLIMQSRIAVLAGRGGIGKSFLALHWALSVASGVDVLGRSVKQGNVVYVAAEGADMFGARIRAWESRTGVTVPRDRFTVIESGVNLSNPDSMARFERTLAARQADLIILDTFSQLSGLEDENSSGRAADVMKSARRLRSLRAGSSILFVHHVTKGKEEAVRGAGAIVDNADTVLRLKSVARGLTLSTELAHGGKQKDGAEMFLEGFALKAYADSCVIEYGSTKPVDIDATKLREVLADGEWMKSTDLRKALTLSETLFRRRVERWVKDGLLEKTGLSTATKYRLA